MEGTRRGVLSPLIDPRDVYSCPSPRRPTPPPSPPPSPPSAIAASAVAASAFAASAVAASVVAASGLAVYIAASEYFPYFPCELRRPRRLRSCCLSSHLLRSHHLRSQCLRSHRLQSHRLRSHLLRPNPNDGAVNNHATMSLQSRLQRRHLKR